MNLIKSPTFAEMAISRRKLKNEFFNQIETIVDFRAVSNIINKHYTKSCNAAGAPSYPGLLLFKMSLLQTWYGLSDYEVEDRLNDSLSFSKFCGLPIDSPAPDHSTLSRFRTEMTQKGVYEKLFKLINKQLEKNKILVKTGAIIDASVIDSPFKPKGKPTYEVVEDRQEEEFSEESKEKEAIATQVVKKYHPSVDTEAKYIKKAGKLRYGYKKHVVTDNEGLVLGVLTTAANVNEITNLEEVLSTADLPKNIPLKADKGYQSAKNEGVLKNFKLKNHILKKAKKNKELTSWEQKFNKIISRTRYKVERTFGSMKLWFHSGVARYKGVAKMHTQNLMEAISYNLYRSPGIIMSNAKKQ